MTTRSKIKHKETGNNENPEKIADIVDHFYSWVKSVEKYEKLIRNAQKEDNVYISYLPDGKVMYGVQHPKQILVDREDVKQALRKWGFSESLIESRIRCFEKCVGECRVYRFAYSDNDIISWTEGKD